MIMKANKQIGFIYKDDESIDRILKDGEVAFEKGFLREKTSTTLPITFGGVGKDLKDYKIYGNTVQSKLPSGYTQVDYIESSGTQYIDTNIYFDFSQNFGIIGKVINPDITTRKVVIGTYEANGQNDYSIEFGGTSNSKPGYLRNYFQALNNSSSNIWSNLALPQDTVIDYDTSYNATNHKCINNIKYNDTSISYDGDVINVTGVSTHPLRLFLDYRTSSVIQNSIKIGNTKIYKNNILVGEFIPCYRNSDNEVGLYDLVNNVFYTNQGTGAFTYGSIAPTPDAPIEMVSCGDRTNNLFDKKNATYKDGYLKDDNGNEQTTAQSGYLTSYIKVEPNKTYTIQGTLKPPTQSAMYRLYFYDIDKNWISRTNGITQIPPYTFTTPSNCYYMQFQYRLDAYDEDTIQIEEGETATSYEPYGYKIPVNVRSDNLFDKDNFTEGYIDSNGVYHADSSIKANALSDYIKIDNNTDYIFSAKNNIYGLNFALYDSNKVFIKRVTSNNTSYNQINSETANYCRVWCNISQQTNITSELIEQYEIQLIKSSSKPSKYIPYYNETTNIYLDEPLRKIGEYSDYIDFKNDKVVRNIDQIIFNGSEDWFKHTTDVGYYYNLNNVISAKALTTYSKGRCICDYFLESNTGSYSAGELNTIWINNQGVSIRIGSVEQTSANDFTTWLSSNNVTVDYALATPTEETITLPNIPTIDGNNTLNIETEITPSQVYIKYKSNT